MRTTLAVDDDILAAAKHLAQRERQTLGQAVSALARLGLARSQRASGTERNGIPLLATKKGSAPVTLALVNQLRDELT
jgi:hypothetical protein